MYVFFFQAEDGIRDRDVTGVQTCASDLVESLRFLLCESRDKDLVTFSTHNSICNLSLVEILAPVCAFMFEGFFLYNMCRISI